MAVPLEAVLIAVRIISLFALLLYASATAVLACRKHENVPLGNFVGIAASGTIFAWSMGWLA